MIKDFPDVSVEQIFDCDVVFDKYSNLSCKKGTRKNWVSSSAPVIGEILVGCDRNNIVVIPMFPLSGTRLLYCVTECHFFV